MFGLDNYFIHNANVLPVHTLVPYHASTWSTTAINCDLSPITWYSSCQQGMTTPVMIWQPTRNMTTSVHAITGCQKHAQLTPEKHMLHCPVNLAQSLHCTENRIINTTMFGVENMITFENITVRFMYSWTKTGNKITFLLLHRNSFNASTQVLFSGVSKHQHANKYFYN